MTAVPNTVRIRNALENAIVAGHYSPGVRLDPEELARKYDVSRTPVREALQQLQASGLVRVVPKRGTFVSQWDVDEVTERIEVMAEIESLCARLAARRISEQELTELEVTHEASRQKAGADDVDGYYTQNSMFHHCIYRATHNDFLVQEATRLHAILQPYRRIQLKVRYRMERSYSEHDTIISAIRTGDQATAAAAMRNHVLVQGDRFHDLVAALRQSPTNKEED